MYCLPIYINNTFIVCRLNPSHSEDKDYIPCYIVERKDKTQSEVSLLRILPESGVFDPSKGKSSDFAVCIESITLNNGEDDVRSLTIKLRRINGNDVDQQEHENDNSIRSNPEGISYDNGGMLCIDDYQKLWTDNPDVASLIIEFELDDCRAKYRLNIALPVNIYDIIIDYGSEASQMWVSSRNPALVPSSINCRAHLFEAMKNEFVEEEVQKLKETIGEKDVRTSKDSRSSDFYQYDPSDQHLFRSRFFIRYKNEEYIDKDSILLLNVKDDLLSVLDDSKYKELPNLKLADHSDFMMPEVLINGKVIQNIYDEIPKLRNLLLTSIIRAGLSQHGSLQGSDEKRVCKVTLLTPNTYSQAILSQVRNDLVRTFNKLDYENINPRLVQGIEVATFSESDASFFGWYDSKKFHKESNGKKILIIDIGKGTTDFSVLELRLNKQTSQIEADRKARSGIVGAGNLMTFALFVSVLVHIINQKGWDRDVTQLPIVMINKKLNEFIKNGDRSKRYKLLQSLEKLKCMPKSPGKRPFADGIVESDNFKNLTQFDDLEITGMVSILDGLTKDGAYYVPEDDEVICGYAEMIAQNLEIELENVYDEKIPVDQLLLMGRGANNIALTNAIINRLNDKAWNKGSISRIKVNKQLLKSACLYGPLNKSVYCSFDGIDVLSWPLPRTDEFHVTPDQEARSKKIEESKKFFSFIFDLGTRKDSAKDVFDETSSKRTESTTTYLDVDTKWHKKYLEKFYAICAGDNNSKSSDQKKTAPSHKEQLTNMQATNNLYYGGHQNVIDVIMGNKEGQTRYLQI